MSKIFSPLNIAIVLVLAGVVFLAYGRFVAEPGPSSKDPSSTESREQASDKGETSPQRSEPEPEEDHQTPTPKVIQEKDEVPERIIEQEEKEDEQRRRGFYQNQTYNYQVTFPKEWPLKISTKEKVAFGHVYPKNGLGAVKVEIGRDVEGELEEAKQEAQAQPGVSIKEERMSVDGVPATKYILVNSMAGSKDFNILVENYGFDYIIKYSDESPEFLGQAEEVVNNFEFTK